MERENRYLVFKNKDINEHLTLEQQAALDAMAEQINIGRGTCEKEILECVVVEHDWPEYEAVWDMIEARVDSE